MFIKNKQTNSPQPKGTATSEVFFSSQGQSSSVSGRKLLDRLSCSSLNLPFLEQCSSDRYSVLTGWMDGEDERKEGMNNKWKSGLMAILYIVCLLYLEN